MAKPAITLDGRCLFADPGGLVGVEELSTVPQSREYQVAVVLEAVASGLLAHVQK